MIFSARRSPRISWLALLALALALTVSGCGGRRGAAVQGAGTQKPTLLPADLAVAFLQEIKSEPSTSYLAGESTIPPCRFTEKGTGSGGEYRKLTGQRAPNQVTAYNQWLLFRIEDPGGTDLRPQSVNAQNPWNYSLRTPNTARTVFGTTDHCIIGPTSEPLRKMVEALSALGVVMEPGLARILR